MAEESHQLAERLHLEHVYVVGHDIGDMVAYAFDRRHPETSRGVMMLDIPRPGPWAVDAVKSDPITWHINYQRTPNLPQQLIAGPEAIYFRCFLDKGAFSDADVAHHAKSYAAPDHLRALLDIYRAFPANEKFKCSAKERDRGAIGAGSWGKLPFREIHAELGRGFAGAWVRKGQDRSHQEQRALRSG